MVETHVVLADAHFPFQDEAALAVALKIAKAAKPDRIWLLGDFLDFAPVSRFRDAARYRHTIQDEFDLLIAWLKKVRRTFPDVPIEYLLGNHEHRQKYFMWSNAKEIESLRTTRFEHQFLLDEDMQPLNLGIHFRTGKHCLTHKFVLKHGSRANLYACRWEYEDEGRSGASGHMHRSGSWSWSRPGTGGDTWYGIGCLCDLNPKYKEDDGKPSPWNHGMAVLTKEGSRVGVENVVIEKGQALWRGRSCTA